MPCEALMHAIYGIIVNTNNPIKSSYKHVIHCVLGETARGLFRSPFIPPADRGGWGRTEEESSKRLQLAYSARTRQAPRQQGRESVALVYGNRFFSMKG